MNEHLLEKPAFTLTVREFIEIMDSRHSDPIQQIKPPEIKPIRGIHELAKFLKCSPVTAQKLKNSGKIPYTQYGRIILFDGEAILQAVKETKHSKKLTQKLK